MAIPKDPHLSIAIGTVHCWSHQTGNSIIYKENNQDEKAAKTVALKCLDSFYPLQEILIL